MNRGAVSSGRAASTAGLNRSVWPTASVAAPRARSATRASASSATAPAASRSAPPCPPRETASRRPRATPSASRPRRRPPRPPSEPRLVDHVRAVRVGDLARALQVGVDDARPDRRPACPTRIRRDARPEVADADDCDSQCLVDLHRVAPRARRWRCRRRWRRRSRPGRRPAASCRRPPTAPSRRCRAAPRWCARRRPARRNACPGSAWRPSPARSPAPASCPARRSISSVPSIASTATTAPSFTATDWPTSSAAMASAIR